MKLTSYNKYLLAFLFLLALSCKKTEIDVDALTDFPPGIISISPADGSKVVAGDFNITVKFADGTISPLASGMITLKDNAGTELGSTSGALSGTEGEIVLAGSEFDAANLALGFYNLDISVTDSKGQTTNKATTFEISNLPFAAIQDEMFLAGSYNGWGADTLRLIADNTWQLLNVELDGGPWKLKNCENWCDKDWADPGCETGFVVEGASDSPCSPTGLYNMTFRDDDLSYFFAPAIFFESNLTSLYLLGTFNDFQGEDYMFNQVADYTWELGEILLSQGDQFRFSEGPFFMGTNFGDNEGDGIAEEFGNNIEFTDDEAFYKVTFNDQTLEYTLEFLRLPSVAIIGSATPNGWDDPDTDMVDNGDGTFSLNIQLTDGELKFRQNDSWDVNWGGSDWPSGTATMGGPDIPVTAGIYDITFTPETGEYDFASNLSVGIIGDATPNGWNDPDTDMNPNGDGTFWLIAGLKNGLMKFRANDDWVINWGSTDWPSGTGTQDGDNFTAVEGIYYITFDSATGDYSFTPMSIGLIGDAQPGGWDTDLDMMINPANPPELMVTVTLTMANAKFRADDDWVHNWGSTDWPNGTAVYGSPDNIPVGAAGTYTVFFDVNTGAYRFE